MAKTKTVKKASPGKSAAKPKTAVKAPARKAAKPAAKTAAKIVVKKASQPVGKGKSKPVKKVTGKPAVKSKVAAKPAPKSPPRKAVRPAPPAKKKPVVAAKPVTNKSPAPAAKQPVAKNVPVAKPIATKQTVPVKPVAPAAPVKTGAAGQITKPSKPANTMSSKDSISTTAKPAAQKAAPSTAAGKAPAPGAGMASPLQAATKGFTPYVMQKSEEYMNDKQKEHFRKILLNWRDELMQEVDRTVHHMQDEAANPPDPADRATLEEEFSLELRTRDRERRLIKKIDSTIELIANDDYGYCDSCGVEIGIRRLEARPTANKCIDCKTLDEIKEKQVGSA